MNTLVKALVLSISTALVAAPAMAAPQDHQQTKPQIQNQYMKAPAQHQSQNAKQNQYKVQKNQKPVQHHKATSNKVAHPAHDWKAGQKVPAQFRGQAYKVDHNKHKKLAKPNRNQQWLNVNGDYVLTNVINHTIIKIIAG
jgi:Ni/Co efflux regulator RcnB